MPNNICCCPIDGRSTHCPTHGSCTCCHGAHWPTHDEPERIIPNRCDCGKVHAVSAPVQLHDDGTGILLEVTDPSGRKGSIELNCLEGDTADIFLAWASERLP